MPPPCLPPPAPPATHARSPQPNTQTLPRPPASIPSCWVLARGSLAGRGSPGSRAGSQRCPLSQVGIQVSYEDLRSGKHRSICKAYATFVAQGPSGSKVSGPWLGWVWPSTTASWLSTHRRVGGPLPAPSVGCTAGCWALGPARGTLLQGGQGWLLSIGAHLRDSPCPRPLRR